MAVGSLTCMVWRLVSIYQSGILGESASYLTTPTCLIHLASVSLVALRTIVSTMQATGRYTDK